MGFPILVRWHLYIESGPWAISCWLQTSLMSKHIVCRLETWQSILFLNHHITFMHDKDVNTMVLAILILINSFQYLGGYKDKFCECNYLVVDSFQKMHHIKYSAYTFFIKWPEVTIQIKCFIKILVNIYTAIFNQNKYNMICLPRFNLNLWQHTVRVYICFFSIFHTLSNCQVI